MKRQIRYIEEFDPVRKKRIKSMSRSLSGIIPSSKNGEEVWFESALERDFALLLENIPDVSRYEEQSVCIEYYYSDKNRVYTPDFFVEFSDDNRKPWLVEIKYRSELKNQFGKLKPKFKAAIQFCQNEGWEFKLITEEYIRTPFLENINFLHRYNHNGVDKSCYKMMKFAISDLGETTPKEYMMSIQDAEFNIKGRCLYALWYGIKIGEIGCDLVNEKINMNSEIWITEKLDFKLVKK